ncbi:hypothetical protein AOLI_G00091430 [Acnodon oligacanthus]
MLITAIRRGDFALEGAWAELEVDEHEQRLQWSTITSSLNLYIARDPLTFRNNKTHHSSQTRSAAAPAQRFKAPLPCPFAGFGWNYAPNARPECGEQWREDIKKERKPKFHLLLTSAVGERERE